MMLHNEYMPSAELVVEIPNGNEVNQLIGVKGANINQLQLETGTHITVQKASEVLPGVTVRRVTISGGDASLRQHCASRILAQVHEFHTAGAAPPPIAMGYGPQSAGPSAGGSTVIEIPNGPEVNFVIGRAGATINALQAETSTRITVQRAAEVPPGAAVRLVTITGPEPQRMRCIALLRAKVLEYQFSAGAPAGGGLAPSAAAGTPAAASGGGCELVIDIPNGLTVNHVIGARGTTINAMQQETGTHISVQRASEVPPGCSVRQVVITGGVEAARERCAALVQAKVAEYQTLTTSASANGAASERPEADAAVTPYGPPTAAAGGSLVLEIPNGNEVNHLIGAKGVTINSLQQETGTHISVQRASEVPTGCSVRQVVITGGSELQRARCCELVRAKVLEYQFEKAEEQPEAKRRKPSMGAPPAVPLGYQMPYYGYGTVGDPAVYGGLAVDPYGQYTDPNLHYAQYYMMGSHLVAPDTGLPPAYADPQGYSAPPTNGSAP